MSIEQDLGAKIEGAETLPKLSRSVKAFYDVPYRVLLTYVDLDLDHAQNVVISTIYNEIEKDLNINLPIVLTQNEARDIADRALYLQRLSRITYTFSLPRAYIAFDPGDIIAMTIDGDVKNLLITDIHYDPRGVLQFSAVENDVDLYSIATSYPPATPRPINQRTTPPAAIVGIDAPLITDQDNGAIYYFLAKAQENWQGAQIYISMDNGETFQLTRADVYGTFFGSADIALSAANPAVIDYASNLVIRPAANCSMTLENITTLQMLNGANTLLVGPELIRFRDADLQQDGSYILRGLQRGIRGTEFAVGLHTPGEAVYLMTPRLPLIGELRPFQAKTLSYNSYETLESAPIISVSPTGTPQLPYAPCHVRGQRIAGDLKITWQRRTRLGGDWYGFGEVPLAETSEAYAIDIHNGAAVVRTLTVSSKAVTYTAAQQTADFGAPQASITIRIYQISSIVGRGRYKEVTL